MTVQAPIESGASAYGTLAARFRPTFERIAQGAVERDSKRILPHEAVGWLKEERFGALRLPKSAGGYGASLSDLFALLAELAAADSNLAQILRAHFGFVENLLQEADTPWGRKWAARVAAGELVAPGWTETGGASFNTFSTTVAESAEGLRLDGTKFYTTGALYSDWIDVGASRGEETVIAQVSTKAPGVVLHDDWNGFGQQLTGSGTAVFENVAVEESDIRPAQARFPYQTAFYQVYHLATLAGIGRAALDGAITYLRARKRTYSHGAGKLAREDPQVLQLFGAVEGKVHAVELLVAHLGSSLDAVFIRSLAETVLEEATATLDAEVYRVQVAVQPLILDATTALFDGLGASALSKDLALDRFWRNARTISSHNPIIYKERIVGDHAVNGTPPPAAWLAGIG